MFTKAFWKRTIRGAIRSAATSFVAVVGGEAIMFNVGWEGMVSIPLTAGVLEVAVALSKDGIDQRRTAIAAGAVGAAAAANAAGQATEVAKHASVEATGVAKDAADQAADVAKQAVSSTADLPETMADTVDGLVKSPKRPQVEGLEQPKPPKG